MKKLLAGVCVVVALSACGVPTADERLSSTTSRGQALETRFETVPPVNIDIGEPLEIAVDVTDARIVERANPLRPEETFFYSVFDTGGRGHCH
jgi:hypothetical protein